MEDRFYKVNETGGTYVVALLYNPVTHETKTECVRDYDYADCRNDNDELYYAPIHEEASEHYRKYLNSLYLGNLKAGDVVEVVKGRKIPHGTIAKVRRVYDWRDCYGRVKNTYAEFEDGRRTSEWNCRIVG